MSNRDVVAPRPNKCLPCRHSSWSAMRRERGEEPRASKLGEVVGLIEEIASQTNLLALNATIEAGLPGAARTADCPNADSVASACAGRPAPASRSMEVAAPPVRTDRPLYDLAAAGRPEMCTDAAVLGSIRLILIVRDLLRDGPAAARIGFCSISRGAMGPSWKRGRARQRSSIQRFFDEATARKIFVRLLVWQRVCSC